MDSEKGWQMSGGDGAPFGASNNSSIERHSGRKKASMCACVNR